MRKRKRHEIVNPGQTTKGLNFPVSVEAWKACRAAAAVSGMAVQSLYREAVEEYAKKLEAKREAKTMKMRPKPAAVQAIYQKAVEDMTRSSRRSVKPRP